jgi:integrase
LLVQFTPLNLRRCGVEGALTRVATRESASERFLSARELGRVGIALARAERTQTETPWALAAIRLLMFTGKRRNEVLSLRWQNVNTERAMLTLPESKTGSRAGQRFARALTTYLNSFPWRFIMAVFYAPSWLPYPGAPHERANICTVKLPG